MVYVGIEAIILDVRAGLRGKEVLRLADCEPSICFLLWIMPLSPSVINWQKLWKGLAEAETSEGPWPAGAKIKDI